MCRKAGSLVMHLKVITQSRERPKDIVVSTTHVHPDPSISQYRISIYGALKASYTPRLNPPRFTADIYEVLCKSWSSRLCCDFWEAMLCTLTDLVDGVLQVWRGSHRPYSQGRNGRYSRSGYGCKCKSGRRWERVGSGARLRSGGEVDRSLLTGIKAWGSAIHLHRPADGRCRQISGRLIDRLRSPKRKTKSRLVG